MPASGSKVWKAGQGKVEFVQLATRVPKSVSRAVAVRCAEQGGYIQDFIVEAIEAALHKAKKNGRKQ